MDLTLSSTDLDHLRAALRVLHTPLSHRSLDEWRATLVRHVRRLMGADEVSILIPGAGHEPFYSERMDPDLLEAYYDYYHTLDDGHELAKERGLEVASYDHLVGREKLLKTEYYNDFLVPGRFHHMLGMSMDVEDGEPPFAYMVASQEADARPFFGERGFALFRLLLPAFKAAVRTYLRLEPRWMTLTALVGTLDERILLCDRKGRPVHRNPALRGALEKDPEGERIEGVMELTARAVARLAGGGDGAGRPDRDAPGEREIRTSRGAYRIYGSFLGDRARCRPALILVVLEPLFPEPLADDEVVERFGLTPQQLRVARRLARDEPNKRIARELGISPHTARRHTERVLRKLGVRSRYRVREKLTRG